jgi:hypothetical protein
MLDFGDRIVVRETERARELGIVGRHGRIAGKSFEDDDDARPVVGYAVAMDEDGERVWMLDPDALERDIARPS